MAKLHFPTILRFQITRDFRFGYFQKREHFWLEFVMAAVYEHAQYLNCHIFETAR